MWSRNKNAAHSQVSSHLAQTWDSEGKWKLSSVITPEFFNFSGDNLQGKLSSSRYFKSSIIVNIKYLSQFHFSPKVLDSTDYCFDDSK